jgi:hypothetical protein
MRRIAGDLFKKIRAVNNPVAGVKVYSGSYPVIVVVVAVVQEEKKPAERLLGSIWMFATFIGRPK